MSTYRVTVDVEVDNRIGPRASFYGWRQDPADHAREAVADRLAPILNDENDWDGKTVRAENVEVQRVALNEGTQFVSFDELHA